MGAVAHPPVPTLDFPLTNAPSKYRSARQKSFATQADAQQIAAELAALGANRADLTATQPDVESGRLLMLSCSVHVDSWRQGPEKWLL
jgi:hypothetical protein